MIDKMALNTREHAAIEWRAAILSSHKVVAALDKDLYAQTRILRRSSHFAQPGARALHITKIQHFLDLGLSDEDVASRCGITSRRAAGLRRYYGFDRNQRHVSLSPGINNFDPDTQKLVRRRTALYLRRFKKLASQAIGYR